VALALAGFAAAAAAATPAAAVGKGAAVAPSLLPSDAPVTGPPATGPPATGTPAVAAPAPSAPAPAAAAVPFAMSAQPDAVGDGVKMAPATPGSVRFTITVPAPQLGTPSATDGQATLALAGYALAGSPGSPGLPRRIVTVAVPPFGDVHLAAVASGLSAREGVLLAPVEGLRRDGVARTTRVAEAYAAAGSAAPAGARLLEVTWIRNQRVAQIAIEPAAYQPGARRLTIASRVDVNVQVQPIGSIGPPAEPRDPYEPVYRATLLNYPQGVAWRRTSVAATVAAAKRTGVRLDFATASATAASPETSIVLANHSWVKLAIKTAGFYAVDFSTLRNTSLFGGSLGVRFDHLRLFTLAGYPLLSDTAFCDSCPMQEAAIGVANDAGNDGMFNNNVDAFYFFAQGPSGWATDFDPSLPDTNYLNHTYETKNYYYLTIDSTSTLPTEPQLGLPPVRITSRANVLPGNPSATVVSTFPDKVHFEVDSPSEYWPDASPGTSSLAWEKWFWVSLTEGDFFDYRFDLPDADTTQAARFRLRQWGLTDNRAYFNNPACYGASDDHYLDVTWNGFAFGRRAWNGYAYDAGYFRQAAVTYDTTAVSIGGAAMLRKTGNALHVQVPVLATPDCPNRVDKSGLAWFDVFYQHALVPRADTLVFSSPGTSGPYHYDVGPFGRSTAPLLFDVTNPVVPVQLRVDPAMWNASTHTLSFEDTASVVRRYRVFPDSIITAVRLPATQVADAPATSLLDNLRSQGNGADYVVIYYDGFEQAATLLAQLRAQRLPVVDHGAPYITKIVPISAVFDQFSGGRTDPDAIRNFLRAAFYNWAVRPKFVEFLGDASYDYKDYKGLATAGQPGCLLPTFENEFDNSNSILRQFATDDRLVNVTDPNSGLPDFFAGRIPADDNNSAVNAVKKLTAYDALTAAGEFENQALLLSDDDLQGAACDQLGWTHLEQTDDLNRNHIPLHMDRDYVYLHTYPTGPGNTKPGARAAVKSYLNGGVTLFNYIGHGSPFKVTDESVFIDTDAGSLTNGSQLFAFVAASCDVGKFNDPTVQSLGEDLVMAGTGGAVAVISATEQALSGLNVNLAKFFYDYMFTRGDVISGADSLRGAGQYHVPLSTALTVAKIRSRGTADTNNRKFQLMGDPATVLKLPHWWVDMSIADLAGNPLTQVQRGQTVQVLGRVLDHPGGNLLPSSGEVSVLIEDSAPTNSTLGNGWDVPPYSDQVCGTSYSYSAATYLAAPGAMYHGNVSVSGGRFAGRFVVPMDANLGTEGRARAYVDGRVPGAAADSDGVGAVAIGVATGTPDATDTQGPRITLSFPGGANAVHPDGTLHIDLFDDSGIMTTGHAAQNSIIVTLDGNTTQRTDVTSTFRYAADSYQQGTATFVLPGVSVGHHTVSVQAADNLATGITASQHRSVATLDFDVVTQATLRIDRAFLFPNPIRSKGAGGGGTFIVNAPGDSLNTMVRIYTISGRVVRTLKNFGSIGQVQIPWDGKDAEGDPLANGTYLFKVYANVRESDGTSSAREEDATVGRFVVVNR